jgi:hypothetical protein
MSGVTARLPVVVILTAISALQELKKKPLA